MAGIESILPARLRSAFVLSLVLSSTYVFPAGLSSEKAGKDMSCERFSAKLYPWPKRVNENCYTGKGHAYRGNLNVSKDGRPCISWRENGNYLRGQIHGRNRYGIGDHNFCRNPDPSDTGGPWCFVGVGAFSRCDVVLCRDYDIGPLAKEAVRTCDRNKVEMIFPDTMYEFRGKVHYATRNDRNSYDIYNFLDGNMTSLDDEPLKTIEQAWDFCTRNNDSITFVTSYNNQSLYAYFERPGVMIRIQFDPSSTWTEVDKSVYENCTTIAEPTFNATSYTSVRQVFSVNEPEVVFLLKNEDMVRCEWRNGTLIYINSTKSPFGSCPRGKLHFIDGHGRYFQLRSPPSLRYTSDNVVRSNVVAVEENPTLAYPLLGYHVLDSKSLIKLRYQRHNKEVRPCTVDGKKSRIYQVYDGQQLETILPYINRSKVRHAWLRIHEINVRKSSFCEDVPEESCCSEIVEQVLPTANRAKKINIDGGCTNEMFLLYCKVDYSKVGFASCPEVTCFDDDDGIRFPGERAICEIPLADDKPCSVRLDEILGTMEEDISYHDAMEALSLMDTIAASMDYQNKKDSKFLSTLVDSVNALEVVDYSSLSPTRAQNLIFDVVSVVDNIVDHESADVWISLQGKDVDTENNGTSSESPTEDGDKRDAIPSPSKVLFTMESVLEGIVSGQVSDNSSNTSNFSVDFETENVISNIRVVGDQEENVDLKGSFVTFEPTEAKTKARRVAIISQYPKLMQLIAKVDKTKSGLTDTTGAEGTCDEAVECTFNRKQDLEYVPHSPVISASMVEKGHKVSAGVTFAIPFTADDIPDPHSRDSKFYFSCRYLATELEGEHWDSRGCKVSKVDHDQKLVYCSCNHTTNFAILLQVVPPKIKKEDLTNLQLVSYVGESISVLCLILTLATFIVFRHSLKSARMVAHFHLVVALLIFHVTQLLATLAEREKNHRAAPCIAVAALTHFSLLASFCWMLVEGILLYVSVISVFHSMKSMNVMRYILGWVVPAVIAGITISYGLTRNPYPTCYLQGVGDTSCPWQQSEDVGFDRGNADSSPMVQLIEWCWLSTSSYLIWAMVVPATIAVLINTVVLIRVAIVIAKTAKATNMYRPTSERKKEQHIRKCLKGAFVLMPILGLPWVIGLIPQAVSHVGLLYAFALLNSIQGFFILLFYCILSSEVRSAFNRCLQKKSLFHSQNNTTSTFGRHSFGDHRAESRRSRKKSGGTSFTDSSKDDGKSATRRNLPTSPLSSGTSSQRDDAPLHDMNNDTKTGKLLSETTAA